MAAAKVATVTAVAAKSNVATRVLTTVVMAKAVPHHVVHVLKAVVLHAVVKVAKAVKTAVATTVTSCHATSTP